MSGKNPKKVRRGKKHQEEPITEQLEWNENPIAEQQVNDETIEEPQEEPQEETAEEPIEEPQEETLEEPQEEPQDYLESVVVEDVQVNIDSEETIENIPGTPEETSANEAEEHSTIFIINQNIEEISVNSDIEDIPEQTEIQLTEEYPENIDYINTYSKQPSPAISKQPSPSISRQSSPVISKVATPAISKQPTPAISKQTSPAISKVATPSISKQPTPAISKQTSPAISKVATPSFSKVASPAISKVVTPAISNQTTPVISSKSSPIYTPNINQVLKTELMLARNSNNKLIRENGIDTTSLSKISIKNNDVISELELSNVNTEIEEAIASNLGYNLDSIVNSNVENGLDNMVSSEMSNLNNTVNSNLENGLDNMVSSKMSNLNNMVNSNMGNGIDNMVNSKMANGNNIALEKMTDYLSSRLGISKTIEEESPEDIAREVAEHQTKIEYDPNTMGMIRKRRVDRQLLANDISSELPISLRYNENIHIDNEAEIENYKDEWCLWVEDGLDKLDELIMLLDELEIKYKNSSRRNRYTANSIQFLNLLLGSGIVYVQSSTTNAELIRDWNTVAGGLSTLSTMVYNYFGFAKKSTHYAVVASNINILNCWVKSKLILPLDKRFSPYDIYIIATKALQTILEEANQKKSDSK